MQERKPSSKNPGQDTLDDLFSVRLLLLASPRITKPKQFLVNRRSILSPLLHILHLHMMVHFEVVLRPNFKSKDPYQVLGCHPSATKEELMTAYRNLSWRYHPQNRPDDPEAMAIFVRLSEAYYALVLSGGKKSALTPREATNVYERRFGRFTRLYYNNGGIVGLPYGFVLKEQLTPEGSHRGPLECGRIKLGFFRAFRLKLKMDWILAILEVFLTGGTIGACKCTLYFCARFQCFTYGSSSSIFRHTLLLGYRSKLRMVY